jgi:hypothetical protein
MVVKAVGKIGYAYLRNKVLPRPASRPCAVPEIPLGGAGAAEDPAAEPRRREPARAGTVRSSNAAAVFFDEVPRYARDLTRNVGADTYPSHDLTRRLALDGQVD